MSWGRALDLLVAIGLALASFAILYFWLGLALGIAAGVGGVVLILGLIFGRNLIHFIPH